MSSQIEKLNFQLQQKVKEKDQTICELQDQKMKLEGQLARLQKEKAKDMFEAMDAEKQRLAEAVTRHAYRAGYEARKMGHREDPKRTLETVREMVKAL